MAEEIFRQGFPVELVFVGEKWQLQGMELPFPVSLTQAFSNVVLPRLGLRPSQVALLRESSTQYGQDLLDTDSASRSTADTGQFVIMPFPMSISSLRAGAY